MLDTGAYTCNLLVSSFLRVWSGKHRHEPNISQNDLISCRSKMIQSRRPNMAQPKRVRIRRNSAMHWCQCYIPSQNIKAYQCHSRCFREKKHEEVAGSSIRKLWCLAMKLQGPTTATFICDLDTSEISRREFRRTAEVTDLYRALVSPANPAIWASIFFIKMNSSKIPQEITIQTKQTNDEWIDLNQNLSLDL